MERYSKTSSSKWQPNYNEKFKRFVCNDFLTGTLTKREIENKYNIEHTRLTYALKEIGFDYSNPSIFTQDERANK